MKIYFFTEGGKSEGLGHITRCVSIYQAFNKRGQDAFMFVNSDQTVKKILRGTRYKIVNWPNRFYEITSSLTSSDIILIDSYKAPLSVYLKASKKFKAAVFLDDYRRLNYPSGIVINPAINVKHLKYPHHRGVKYLTGIKYAPLRKAFWTLRKKEIRGDVFSILITFGASIDKSFLFSILKSLDHFYPSVTKKVIVGLNSVSSRDIERLGVKKTHFLFSPSSNRIKMEMAKSDLAISGGGQTLNELAAIGVPTISVCLSKDQVTNIEGWLKKGFIQYVGSWEDRNIIENIVHAVQKTRNVDLRKKTSTAGQSCIDGAGSSRIADRILKWLN